MKLINSLLFLLLFIFSCSEKNITKNILKEDENCAKIKAESEKAFQNKNYAQTIKLLKNMENCFLNKSTFYLKLALLNSDLENPPAFEENLVLSLNEIENEKNHSKNEKIIYKAFILSLLGNKTDAKMEFNKLNKSRLSKTHQSMYEFIEMFVNQGEFISTKWRVEYKLFE